MSAMVKFHDGHHGVQVACVAGPGSPTLDETSEPLKSLAPFLQSLAVIFEAIGKDGRVTEGAGADSSDNARLLVLLQASVGETDARRAKRAAREAEYMSQPRRTAGLWQWLWEDAGNEEAMLCFIFGRSGLPRWTEFFRSNKVASWLLGCLGCFAAPPSAQHPEQERKTNTVNSAP